MLNKIDVEFKTSPPASSEGEGVPGIKKEGMAGQHVTNGIYTKKRMILSDDEEERVSSTKKKSKDKLDKRGRDKRALTELMEVDDGKRALKFI